MASPTYRACYLFPALSAKPYVDNDSQRYDEDSEEKQARKIIERYEGARVDACSSSDSRISILNEGR